MSARMPPNRTNAPAPTTPETSPSKRVPGPRSNSSARAGRSAHRIGVPLGPGRVAFAPERATDLGKSLRGGASSRRRSPRAALGARPGRGSGGSASEVGRRDCPGRRGRGCDPRNGPASASEAQAMYASRPCAAFGLAGDQPTRLAREVAGLLRRDRLAGPGWAHRVRRAARSSSGSAPVGLLVDPIQGQDPPALEEPATRSLVRIIRYSISLWPRSAERSAPRLPGRPRS